MIVTEVIDAIPINESTRQVQRDEKLLHTWPDPGALNIWRSYEPLGVISFPMKRILSKFSPPQGIYEEQGVVRFEYQSMEGRQPIYHRNVDVDEIAYQVSGHRTLMTEKGTVDLEVGDFSRIPVGVCHDNRGTDDVHLIFYIPAPVAECVPVTRTTEYRMPPFPGWENSTAIEFITSNLSALGGDVSTFLTDEKLLLETAKTDLEPISVLRPSSASVGKAEWLYKAEGVWLGTATLSSSTGTTYRRHLAADEIQVQLEGSRTLVTQRGTVILEPGDFVNIPLGCAFTSIHEEESTHIKLLLRHHAPAVKKFTKRAIQTSLDFVDKARRSVQRE